MTKRDAHKIALKLAADLLFQSIDAGGWTTWVTASGETGDMYDSEEDDTKIEQALEAIAIRLLERHEALDQ